MRGRLVGERGLRGRGSGLLESLGVTSAVDSKLVKGILIARREVRMGHSEAVGRQNNLRTGHPAAVRKTYQGAVSLVLHLVDLAIIRVQELQSGVSDKREVR